jgi:transposase
MGRPTKLTPEVKDRLLSALRAGNYLEPACVYAGISYQTFLNWKERGEREGRGPYFEFLEAINKAMADAEIRAVAQWQQAMPENWQAVRDFLDRRHPDRWRKREELQHTGKDGAPLPIVVMPSAPPVEPES